MSKKKGRFGFLLVGIFLGIIVGISFMWWGRNLQQTDWISFHRINALLNRILPGEDPVEDSLVIREKQSRNSKVSPGFSPLDTIPFDAYADSLAFADSLTGAYNDYYIAEEELPDTLRWFMRARKNSRITDSMQSDTGVISSRGKETILRDQFLMAKIMIIKGKSDSLSKTRSYLDSLLTNDKMTPRMADNKLRVELWKSPVNYKGYKFTGNKLILFGFESLDRISLEQINRKIILKYLNNYYPLETGDQFKPYIQARKNELVLNTGH